MKNKKKGFLILTAILVVLTIGICGYLFFEGNPPIIDVEKGTADGASALWALREISGESRVDTLADVRAASEEEAPERYLEKNSIYVMDEEAVGRAVQSYLIGAESTADAQGMTAEELIVGKWGYESVDAYREQVADDLERFVRQRLAVYEVAKDRHISITEQEYEERLSEYAARYGYEDTAVFSFECTPASIASEMLYDKTILKIRGL